MDKNGQKTIELVKRLDLRLFSDDLYGSPIMVVGEGRIGTLIREIS